MPGPERARPPEDIDPAEFFTRWVPQAVSGDPERQRRLGDTSATIEFRVKGEPGGTFTVTIEGGAVDGREGEARDADLRVEVDLETWRALNRGSLSAPEALLRRRVHLKGSFVLALKLHLILA